MNKMETGIRLIAEERQKQIQNKSMALYPNDNKQLIMGCWILIDPHFDIFFRMNGCPQKWDGDMWADMVSKSYEERLIIAGAFIAAEIDSLKSASKEVQKELSTEII